jgi:RNA polymerase sigma-70 factor (sigma-E family)
MREPEGDDFDGFVAARTPALLRTAYLLTGDQHLSEDLVQTALEKALPTWGARKVTPATESYVRTIMYRENISIWRRRRGREIPVAELPEPRMASPAGDQVEDQVMLRAALLRLGARQRTVLVLRYYEDLTEAQVAQVMGVSVGTVKSQTSKALARLRRASPDLHPAPAPRRDARLSEELP